ncbi:disulfide bond formation protein B [Algiphilus sp.]|uniref:disulfide bond formation protein B n=1 Tax=Algiphilus sp. TaxID=1872431 RepID=UPI003C66D5B8
MLVLRSFRLLSLVGFLACAGAMAFALWLEHFGGLEPCPMCIFQRIAMIAAGVVFLVAALHGPGAAGRWVYAVLVWLTAGAGAVIAGRHVWLQSLPEDQVPACGPTLDFLVDALPIWEVVTTVLSGDGNCAIIDWSWMGLSLPAWTLVGFVALMIWALLAAILPRPTTTV